MEWVLKIINDWNEKQEKKKTAYRKEFLDFYFDKIEQGQEFSMLELFDPFAYPMIVRPEDVIRYISEKEARLLTKINYYSKCPLCDSNNREIKKEEINESEILCHKCKTPFKLSKDSSYMVFIKT